jgi:hypothetical protein
MLLKELILQSLESFDSFMLDNKQLTKELYEQFADYEIKNYYLDINKTNNQPIIVVTIEL